ncbi:HAD-IIIA family hydrolase [Litoribacter ruber]|uniref:KdsC family phosphatase n=1 Tax=Litoribacter ruber TaxID=702568 RepID=UPI001BDA6DA5|nr:HAD-IIIA family hydrolase [Litoribacter ruber]MBT0811211.1 HAD-IIIA family hydrolase [Litoribacter ruber]
MKEYFGHVPAEVFDKASKIKLLVTDVDGVLTDGGVIYDDHKTEFKRFQVKDGQIVQFLKAHDIRIGVITGRNSLVVKNRCEELGFDFHFHGVKEKSLVFLSQLKALGLTLDQCAYIGDDIIDLPILKNVGFSACPNDAMSYVKDKVDFVSEFNGGDGVFREVADILLESQGKLGSVIEHLISQKLQNP